MRWGRHGKVHMELISLMIRIVNCVVYSGSGIGLMIFYLASFLLFLKNVQKVTRLKRILINRLIRSAIGR